jgi:hypothetical protein
LGQSELPLYLWCGGEEPEGVVELTRSLREDILLIDVEDVRLTTTSAPAGAKSGDVLAIGALVVAVAPVFAAGLADVLVSWLRRQPLDVEIEVDGQRFKGPVTKTQRDELVAAILRRTDSGS